MVGSRAAAANGSAPQFCERDLDEALTTVEVLVLGLSLADDEPK
jgi:hypothetical protein